MVKAAYKLRAFNIITHVLKLKPKPQDYFSEEDRIIEIKKCGSVVWADFSLAQYITFLNERKELMTRNLTPPKLGLRSFIPKRLTFIP